MTGAQACRMPHDVTSLSGEDEMGCGPEGHLPFFTHAPPFSSNRDFLRRDFK